MPPRRMEAASNPLSVQYPSSDDNIEDELYNPDELEHDGDMQEPDDDADDADIDDPVSTGEYLWSFPPPRGLKEISGLATWTVSTSKPDCGVQGLRNSDPGTFWQSDGPQPHVLNIHFIKLVRIIHMRFYVDSSLDESYTPQKMHFLAGTSLHDLREVCTMTLSQPRGWIDVDMSNVGGAPAFPEGAEVQLDEEDDELGQRVRGKVAGGTLPCFLIQVRISENHQNGKDTHLRGLQIFARDKTFGREKRKPVERELTRRAKQELGGEQMLLGLKQPDWMGEPVLR